ncbi:TerD family protein [Nocardioides sp.]|uniref:TerD family protein n=1 Tax=Nocardioides sp. TaxID=35761 RepID=UPI003513D53A
MTALRSGENRPWPHLRFTAYLDGARVAGLLLGADGRAVTARPWLLPGVAVPGVDLLPGPPAGLSAVVGSIPAEVATVLVIATGFSSAPTAHLVADDGAVVATVTPASLAGETALVMAQLYRRDGAWKVRALAQGYRGGLAELSSVYGAPAPDASAPPPPPPTTAAPAPIPTPSPTPSPAPSAGPAPVSAVPPDLDPVRQVSMILDDASRTTASRESTERFAREQLERDLERIVGDPALRVGPAADAARAAAQQQHDRLVGQARDRHATDLAQLTRELDDLERRLPASLAGWDSPAWSGGVVETEPAWAVRVGELAPVANPAFRLPMVRTVPFTPPLWIEFDGHRTTAPGAMLVSLAIRVALASPRPPHISVIDVGGRTPLTGLPARTTVATDAATAAAVLEEHVQHLGLVDMARGSGGLEHLPPDQRPGRLLILTDLPGVLDESSVARLHQVLLQGPGLGTGLVLAGRDPAPLGLPVLDAMRQSCLRITPTPGGDLTDGFGGVDWIFHPDLGPADPDTATRVQSTLAARTTDPGRPGG